MSLSASALSAALSRNSTTPSIISTVDHLPRPVDLKEEKNKKRLEITEKLLKLGDEVLKDPSSPSRDQLLSTIFINILKFNILKKNDLLTTKMTKIFCGINDSTVVKKTLKDWDDLYTRFQTEKT